jgi:hypothetical protein
MSLWGHLGKWLSSDEPTEVTPVFGTGREAKIVVKRPSEKPGGTHGPEAEDAYGGVQSAAGGVTLWGQVLLDASPDIR